MNIQTDNNSNILIIGPASEWVKRWWTWILETPASKNPAYGYKYSHFEIPSKDNQPYDSENVWFLAGAINDGSLPHSHNQVHRTITVPSNKALLIPVINYFATVEKERDISNLERRVKEEMDVINPESLYVTIDDKQILSSELMKYRVDTKKPFQITVKGDDNVLRLRHLLGRNIKRWAKGDGYWLFLKPLPVGEHKIHTFGSCLQGKIQIDVQYNIIITTS